MKPSPYAQGSQFESPPNSGRGAADVYNSAGIGVSWYASGRSPPMHFVQRHLQSLRRLLMYVCFVRTLSQ